MPLTDVIDTRYAYSEAVSPESEQMRAIIEENRLLRQEIRVAREAAQITADLVVKQFVDIEEILQRFQAANAMRKAVLDSALQIAIIATDKDGVIVVFNSGAENMLGYAVEEVIGKRTPEEFILASELAQQAEALSHRRGRPVSGLDVMFAYSQKAGGTQLGWTCVKKNGQQFPVQMSINALRDADGEITGLLMIANDISEQRRSEMALKESERNYRLLLKNLPNVVFKGYADGAIDFIDDKILALTGYTKEEFLSGRTMWRDIVVPDDFDYVKQQFVKALKTTKSYIREYRIRSKSGEIYWLEEGGQIICDENGNIEFVIGAFLNITERKLAEQALYESEQKYRSLFTSGPNPILVLDKETFEILDANPQAAETFGYGKTDLVGKKYIDFGTFEQDDKRPIRIDRDGWPSDGMVIQKLPGQQGDPTRYLRIKVSPTIYKGRQATILAGTDISEVIEKDAQLIQASKMTTLGEMSAGIAHELNQPLNAIRLGNEFLKTMIEKNLKIPDQDLHHVVSEVNEQVARASDIINRLREFGRKTEDIKQPVDINDPIIGVLKIIGRQLQLESIQVELKLAKRPPKILAHGNRLEQVLFNLITNARDAINKKRQVEQDSAGAHTITLETFHSKRRVGVRISDTGTGIPNEIRDKVFEPFFTTKDVGAGMGLGLSIIYGIIRDYGGEIDVESQEGKGTTFTYSFPAVD